MKKLILILIPLALFAGPKSRLKDCEESLQKMMMSKTILVDTIYLTSKAETKRKDVKIAISKEKTKRKALIAQKHEVLAELKTIKAIEKIENKTEIKTDKFLNFMQGMTRTALILVGGGLISSGLLITKALQFLKGKFSWFSWLPI